MKNQILIFVAAAALLTACGTTESQMGMGTQLQDLPAAAQASIQQQIGNAQILDIDKEQRTGHDVYEVTYRDSAGTKQKLHVGADGAILGQRQAGMTGIANEAAGASQTEKSSTVEPSNQQGYQQQGYQQQEYQQRGELQQGSSQGEFRASSSSSQSSSEPATQANVDARAQTDSQHIQAERDVRGGAQGLQQNESQSANEPSGAERRNQSGELKSESSSSTDQNASKESAGAGKEPSEMTVKFDDLPTAVQTALRDKGNESDIKEIEKTTKDGKTVYEVEFKDSDKKPMCFSEDGTVIEKEKDQDK